MAPNSTKLQAKWICLLLGIVGLLSIHSASVGNILVTPPKTATEQTTTARPAIHAIPSTDNTAIFIAAERLTGIDTPIYATLGPTSHDRGHTGEMQLNPQAGAYVYTFEGVNNEGASARSITITTTTGTTGPVIVGVSTVALGYIPGNSFTQLTSSDRNLLLDVPTGVLSNTYMIIMDTVAPPADPPPGHRMLTQSYSIRPSGAITHSLAPVLLRLSYLPEALAASDPRTIAMLRWNATPRRWEDVESEPFVDPTIPGGASTAHYKGIDYFGTYALMVGTTWRDAFPDTSGLAERNNIRLAFGGKLGLPSNARQGYAVSVPIVAAQPFSSWGKLHYTTEITSGTAITVDVLATDDNTVLMTNLNDGASLSAIDAVQHPSLRLRVTLSTQQAGITPYLEKWSVHWLPPHQLFLPFIQHAAPATTQATVAIQEPTVASASLATGTPAQPTEQDHLGCDPLAAPTVAWSAAQTISNPDLFAIAPDLAVDSEGRLHTIWLGGGGHLEDANLFYATKEAGSNTWSTPVVLLPSGSQAWYPALAIDPQDTLHVVWYQTTPFTFAANLQYMAKPRGGEWSSPLTLAATGQVRKGPNQDIFADTQGAIHVVWSDQSPGNDEVFYLMKQAGQTTWQPREQVSHTPDNSAAPTLVVDSSGTTHVAWYDVARNAEVYYASKPPTASSWNEAINVSQSAAGSLWPAIAIDHNDIVHLLWQENAQSAATQMITLTYTTKPAAAAIFTGSVQALAQTAIPFLSTENVQAPALTVGAGGSLHVAWTTMTERKVYYVTRPDAETRWSAPAVVASVLPPFDPTDNFLTALAIDKQGAIHLLWGDMRSSENFRDMLKYAAAQPLPIPSSHVLVLDEKKQAVVGACVYHNGRPVGATDTFGILSLPDLTVGDHLVALKPITQQPSRRQNDWAYRTALTSLTLDAAGQVSGYVVSAALGRQRLQLQTRPLIYFNLQIAIQWNATDEYIAQLAKGVRHASDYLFDVSDGQMAFGQVAIEDDSQNWDKADIQILTRNDVRPYAYVGGILESDPAKKLIVGRHWNGSNGAEGAWNERNGFRTLVHEFGHYGLHLYDSYFEYTFNDNHQVNGFNFLTGCTDPVEWNKATNQLVTPNPATDAINASIMTYQYASSELAAKGVPGLWEIDCEHTAQWQLNEGESDWETILRYYKDQQQPARWQLLSPFDRQGVLAGPEKLPADWLAFPLIITQPVTVPTAVSPITLTILNADKTLYREPALVALETKRANGQQVILDQGQTRNGQITIYGATLNDKVRVVSLGGNLSAEFLIKTANADTVILGNPRHETRQAAAAPINPYLSLTPGSDGDNLTLSMHGVESGATLQVVVFPPDNLVAQTAKLGYSPAASAYTGTISFNNTIVGLGSAHVRGVDATAQTIAVNSDFSMLKVTTTTNQDLFTPDGRGWLHLAPDSFPAGNVYLIFMPTGAVPQPLPEDMAVVGAAYSLRSSGSLTNLRNPALLSLFHDPAQVGPCVDPASIQIGAWNGEQWTLQPGQVDEDHHAITKTITRLGIYALFAPIAASPAALQNCYQSHLPLIAKP